MTRWLALAAIAPLLAACDPEGSGPINSGPCHDLCTALVEDCGYAAYPSFDSCAQGCVYSESEGADVRGQAECVQTAECNTFDIVECEHAYGIN